MPRAAACCGQAWRHGRTRPSSCGIIHTALSGPPGRRRDYHPGTRGGARIPQEHATCFYSAGDAAEVCPSGSARRTPTVGRPSACSLPHGPADYLASTAVPHKIGGPGAARVRPKMKERRYALALLALSILRAYLPEKTTAKYFMPSGPKANATPTYENRGSMMFSLWLGLFMKPVNAVAVDWSSG